MSSAPSISSAKLKETALALGFARVGLAPAEPVPSSVREHYRTWIRQGGHASMQYLENYEAQRFDPRLLVEGVQTIISLALSYHPGTSPTQKGLAWYAQGEDYHTVMKAKLNALLATLALEGRAFADTAPVLEKYWAWRAGVGFVGRHTQLVVPRLGSAFFLGEVFITATADHYDAPITASPFEGKCGACHRCEQACPTSAINDGTLRAERCLSYLSIEHRGELPEWAKPHMRECFYGCDRCLRACPHLHAPQTAPLPALQAKAELLAMDAEQWNTLTEEQYRALFKGSAVKRAKFGGLKRNIQASDV